MQSATVITALNAVTATTTSNKICVSGFNKIAILVRAASITSGNGVFSVKGGFGQYDDSNPTMTTLNTLIDNVTNTNAQTLTRVAGKTLSANGDAFLWVSPETPVTHLELTVTRTTDGTYSAYIIGFN